MHQTTTQLDGPRLEPQGGGPARQLVVLLHGLGADGNDLIQLAPYLAQALPEAAFVSPHAPEPCDLAPYGRQWFSLRDTDPQVLLQGVRAAAPVLEGFLRAELDRYGLRAGKLALFGFSQGGMMALHVGLRWPEPIAGICGFSTALVGADRLPEEAHAQPPVLLVHGDSDQVIPPQAMSAAVAALKANQIPVITESRPGLDHGIDERGIQLAIDFLQRHLSGDG